MNISPVLLVLVFGCGCAGVGWWLGSYGRHETRLDPKLELALLGVLAVVVLLLGLGVIAQTWQDDPAPGQPVIDYEQPVGAEAGGG